MSFICVVVFTHRVIVRERNEGLVSQWLNVWIPESDSELAFVFEDDIEVSIVIIIICPG